MASPDDATAAAEPVLYFGYGADLSTVHMRSRCPDSTPIGLAYLHGWAWLVNDRGRANLVELPPRDDDDDDDDGPGVYGLLYRLPRADVAAATEDREAVLLSVERVDLCASSSGSSTSSSAEPELLDALVCLDRTQTGAGAPRPDCIVRMNRAIDEATAQWGLPGWYVDAVFRRFIPPA